MLYKQPLAYSIWHSCLLAKLCCSLYFVLPSLSPGGQQQVCKPNGSRTMQWERLSAVLNRRNKEKKS